jgi:multiple sugar transport system substrate-binding protein
MTPVDAGGRVREWNDQHPTRRAVSVELPSAADLQRADLIARLQAGRVDHDVLGLDVVWTAEFARGGYITPLDTVEDDLRLDRFLAPALDSARFEGRLWAVPLFSNAGLLYYRTDLVKRVPETWAELAEQARELGRLHKIAGYVGQLARYEGLTVNLVEAIWGQGGDLLQADGLHLDAAATTRGLAFLRDGLDGGWIPGTARAYDEEQSRQAFQRGQALFMRNWPYAYDQLTAQDSQVKGDFGVARLPGPSALGGANLAISRFSRKKKTALDFIRFLTDEARQQATFEDGGYPAVLSSIYQDPNVQAHQPYSLALRDSIDNARSRPSTPTTVRSRGRSRRPRSRCWGSGRTRPAPPSGSRRRYRRPSGAPSRAGAAPLHDLEFAHVHWCCQVEGSSPPTLRQHAAACAAGARATSFGGETSTRPVRPADVGRQAGTGVTR